MSGLVGITGKQKLSRWTPRSALASTVAAGSVAVGSACTEATAPIKPHNVTVQVSNTVTGRLALAMSTSFQPATYDEYFFQDNPGATVPLGALEPQHIRLQSLGDGNPQTSPTSWNFVTLDAITQPVLTVGDHSPEFELGQGPPFMYDANGNLLDQTFGQFATYAANMVRYYNTGGFSAADGRHASPSNNPITYWGIYNEPNINNLTSAQYTALYNATVPAMHAADPSIKFVAVELAGGLYDDQNYLVPFLGGVTAQIDVIALHFYSTCNQMVLDTTVFAAVPGFAASTQYVAQLGGPAKGVPVWITENNVDAGFNLGNGINACTGQPFVLDKRGSSAFFAAWRPYVFSQVGQAGARALYHWDYDADAQYGEVNYTTGAYQLSYWVDYWLARVFPSPPGANILRVTNSDPSDFEVLAVRNDDGSAAVMIANHSVASVKDNNGPGAPGTISVDVTQLGTFQTANLLLLDARTDPSQAPAPAAVPFQSTMTISLPGYGVAFLTLK